MKAVHPAIAKRGRLELSFARAPDGKTFIDKQFCSYPFHLCRPFYLDEGTAAGIASIYTQSCAGGIFARDNLLTEINVASKAQAHLTSQASTIVHDGSQGKAEQICKISADAGSLVEYVPDPIILFSGARLKSSVYLSVDETAGVILFDSFLAHDHRGCGQFFDLFKNNIQIVKKDGSPLVTDRFELTGEEFAANKIGQMGGFTCHGSVLALVPGVDLNPLIRSVRTIFKSFDGGVIGISRLPLVNGFSARILARDAVPMKRAMLTLWALSREALIGQTPEIRRK